MRSRSCFLALYLTLAIGLIAPVLAQDQDQDQDQEAPRRPSVAPT